MFLFFALLSALLSYLNFDPMKSSFFLIFSLLCTMPLVSFGSHIWFSYFVCLLFLSGVFVILVYFSSLSSISVGGGFLSLFLLFITLLSFSGFFYFFGQALNLNVFYYTLYVWVLVFILFSLLFFMNFSSYFLSFSGALRKV